eukprot:6205288-Pleurochrysis_carterae.AAC.1
MRSCLTAVLIVQYGITECDAASRSVARSCLGCAGSSPGQRGSRSAKILKQSNISPGVETDSSLELRRAFCAVSRRGMARGAHSSYIAAGARRRSEGAELPPAIRPI